LSVVWMIPGSPQLSFLTLGNLSPICKKHDVSRYQLSENTPIK
jgi:hypothetical protein